MASAASADLFQPHRIPVGFALGFAVFGAPAAWFSQLLINYALASRSCYPTTMPFAEPWIGYIWWVLLGVDCLAIIAAVAAGYLAISHWRRRRDLGQDMQGADRSRVAGEHRNRFLAMWAMATSGLFLTTVIFTFVLLFILPVCNG